MSVITVEPKRKELRKNKDKSENKPKEEPVFNVILWNDDDHTFEYVVRMLGELFGYPAERGLQLAWQVHTAGKAIIFSSSLEQAEIKRDKVLAFGADPLMPKCSGPLAATLERAVV
ncbi:MAG: ATP-dependent Clp protease adaptor ClpS [Planctomycetaceae bacterium]|jgi:ATP-dependent Clp protease adaptor protein ClpS|nr:ATP-dependent Clp protease adaptor ClpS [Planctomycetaceae bacterium]